MTENYRSSRHVVDFANAFVTAIRQRLQNRAHNIHELRRRLRRPPPPHLAHHVPPARRRPHRPPGHRHRLRPHLTNEEAVILVALLRKHGLRSKLIRHGRPPLPQHGRSANVPQTHLRRQPLAHNLRRPLGNSQAEDIRTLRRLGQPTPCAAASSSSRSQTAPSTSPISRSSSSNHRSKTSATSRRRCRRLHNP